jgi:N-terminal domain of anti-restriction factor ArdC
MNDEKKQKIQAIFQSVKDLTQDQKDQLMMQLSIKNPEGHFLSGNNCLLLDRQAAMYNPNISFSIVGGFNQWQKHNRKVKKGESGFYIAIPSKKQEKQSENNDEVFFFFKAVFDISQTEQISSES